MRRYLKSAAKPLHVGSTGASIDVHIQTGVSTMRYLRFANLTGAQMRCLSILYSATIWALIFFAGYEYAVLCDWLKEIIKITHRGG